MKLKSILNEAQSPTLESELRRVIAKELSGIISGNEQQILASKIQGAVIKVLIDQKLLPF